MSSTSGVAPEHATNGILALDDALVKMQHLSDSMKDALAVGDSWDFNSQNAPDGCEMRIILRSKPTLNHPTRPCRLEVRVPLSTSALLSALLPPDSNFHGSNREGSGCSGARVALCDFIARRLQAAIAGYPPALEHGIRSCPVGPFCLETNWISICPDKGGCSSIRMILEIVGATAGSRAHLQGERRAKRRAPGQAQGDAENSTVESVIATVKKALLIGDQSAGGLDVDAARAHVESIEDQRHLRDLVASSDGVAFIADGAILPRRGGADDAPMELAQGAVPFESPPSLRREFELPHRGRITGMLVPRGVTVIVGGAYHGKSTLLRALAVGVYDKVPGDGREFAVTDPGAVTIRAEDGRPVSGIDISPFIAALPCPKPTAALTTSTGQENAKDIDKANETKAIVAPRQSAEVADTLTGAVAAAASNSAGKLSGGEKCGTGRERNFTKWFSSEAASGSTSQAANVMEALEAGASALLLDEDTCAGNFMVRDSRMRAMVSHEPITPFIYRVSSLWLELGVSSVIVVGGCGDYFDIHNTAILVDNYVATDATERAHSISRRYCVGRVQYAGRGLVHRLPWPGDPSPRSVIPQSILSTRKVVGKKRKREDVGDETDDGTPKPDNGVGIVKNIDSEAETVRDVNQHHAPGILANGVGERGGFRKGVDRHERVDESSEVDSSSEREWVVSARPREGSCTCLFGAAAAAHAIGNGSNKSARVGRRSADVSRVEQIVGGAAQTRGCALGVEWVARATEKSPGLTIAAALDALDSALRENEGHGLQTLLALTEGQERGLGADHDRSHDLVAKPRRFEVAAALHRLPGVRFERVVADVAGSVVGNSKEQA